MDIPARELDVKDIVIAVMGPTGAGKSHFIDVVSNQLGKRSSNRLDSYTSEVQASVLTEYENEHKLRVVLVDTPGFDDTYKSDIKILDMIGQWLEKTYKKKIKLTGILYMHRISDNRVGGTPLKNLRMFGELCGDLAMSRVILVTTMWGLVEESAGERREIDLKTNFWNGMLENGSRVARFHNSYRSAKDIVDTLIAEGQKRETLLLQEELVDLGRHLNETHAGKMLYSTLQRLLEEQKGSIDKLINQIGKESDGSNPHILQALRKDQEKIEEELRKTLEGVRRLKVPLSRKIILFLFGKKGKIKGVSAPDPSLED